MRKLREARQLLAADARRVEAFEPEEQLGGLCRREERAGGLEQDGVLLLDVLAQQRGVRACRRRGHTRVAVRDAHNVGRRREQFLETKLAQALADTGVQVSLAAESEGAVVGFLLARVYYGEFGRVEPVAVLDTLAVDPKVARAGVASALLAQLRTNLLGLGIPVLQTEVAWDQQDLLSFFHHAGFRPAQRLCLDLDLHAARLRAEEREAAAQLA